MELLCYLQEVGAHGDGYVAIFACEAPRLAEPG